MQHLKRINTCRLFHMIDLSNLCVFRFEMDMISDIVKLKYAQSLYMMSFIMFACLLTKL